MPQKFYKRFSMYLYTSRDTATLGIHKKKKTILASF